MERWQWISLILCVFGFLKEFRPSEPFVTEFLIEYKNFTKSTVVHVAYPIGTYSYLASLPVVFLITDFVRYKAVIILEGIAYVLTYSLLIWGNGLSNLKIAEVLYGIASSTEVAYYTYAYAKVKREQYKKVTSFTYAATLTGNFIAAIASQSLISFKIMNYYDLNYLTLISVSAALLVSVFLPGVKKSIYFYRSIDTDLPNHIYDATADTRQEKETFGELSYSRRLQKVYKILWRDLVSAYSNSHVLKWSVWCTISSAGLVQVINYVQPLYESIYSYKTGEIYNAGVDAVHTILSVVAALIVGHVSIAWNNWGEFLLLGTSVVQGLLLLIMAQTSVIYVAYGCYILFRTLYQILITVASSEVAQGISDDSHGLIFGLNKFMALLVQSLLTLAFTDQKGLALDERSQFLVYGSYFLIVGVIFGIAELKSLREERNSTSLPEDVSETAESALK